MRIVDTIRIIGRRKLQLFRRKLRRMRIHKKFKEWMADTIHGFKNQSSHRKDTNMITRLVVTAIILGGVIAIAGVIDLSGAIEGFRLSLFAAYAAITYLVFSFRFTQTVKPGTHAVVLRFGKAVGVVKEGLPFAPLGVYTLQEVVITQQQKELPGEPNEVWNGEITQLPPGKVPSVRIAFRDSITREEAEEAFGEDFTVQIPNTADTVSFVWGVKKDGMSRRVTTEVTAVVVWRIDDAIAVVQNFSKPEQDIKKQLEDEIFQILEAQLPKMSLAQALINKRWLNAQILRAAIQRADGWGITVLAAYIKNFPIHHDLNDAIGQAAEAEFKGRASKELLIQEGKGKAAAALILEQSTLKGRGQGLRDAAKATGLTPAELQAAEVARTIGESGNTVVVGTEGISQLIGAAAAALKTKK